MRKLLMPALLAVFAMIPFSRVEAAPITVPSFSFEEPDVLDQTSAQVTPAGWTFSGPLANSFVFSSIYDPSSGIYSNTTGLANTLPGTADGYQYVSIDNSGFSIAGEWALTTTSPVASVADNTTYTLTVALGSGKPSTPFEFTFLDLLVNDAPVATTQVARASIPEDTFGDFSASFTTGVGSPLSGGDLAIRLRVSDTAFGVKFGDFDNVRLDASAAGQGQPPAVPEPASLMLVALGGGWAALRRRTAARRP